MRIEPDSVTFAVRASSVTVERPLAVPSWQLLFSLLCVRGVHLFSIQRRISVSGRPQQRRKTMSATLSNPSAESFCTLNTRSRDFGIIIIKLDNQKGKNRPRWNQVRFALHMHCCNASHDAFSHVEAWNERLRRKIDGPAVWHCIESAVTTHTPRGTVSSRDPLTEEHNTTSFYLHAQVCTTNPHVHHPRPRSSPCSL